MVSEKSQHLVHQLAWTPVPEPSQAEQTASALALAEAERGKETILQLVVLVCPRRIFQQVQEALGCALIERSNDVGILGVITRNASQKELGLDLDEPGSGLRGPKGWQFERNCGVSHP